MRGLLSLLTTLLPLLVVLSRAQLQEIVIDPSGNGSPGSFAVVNDPLIASLVFSAAGDGSDFEPWYE